MILRDRALGWTKRGRVPAGIHERASRHAIPSGSTMFSTRYLSNRFAFRPTPQCCFVMELAKPWNSGSACSSFSPPMALLRWSLITPDTARAPASRIGSSSNLTRSPPLPRCEKLAPELPVSVLGFSLGSWHGRGNQRSDRRPAPHSLRRPLPRFAALPSPSGSLVRLPVSSRPSGMRNCGSRLQAAGPYRSWRERPALSHRNGARSGWLVPAAGGGCSGPQYHPQPAIPQAASFLLGTNHRMASR